MIKRKKIIWGVVSFSFVCLFAMAANPKVFKNNSPIISKYFGTAHPMGEGSVKKYMFTLYQLALWAKDNKFSYDNQLGLEAFQEVEAPKEDLIEETLNKLDYRNHLPPKKRKQYKAYLEKVYPPIIHPNDVWTVVYIPNQSINFYFNNELYGTIDDMDFAKRYFNIWLAPDGDFQDLRKELLRHQKA